LPNTHKFLENYVGLKCLQILKNSIEIGRVYNTEQNEDYKKPFAIGETTQVKLPQRWTVRDGLNYQEQAISRRSVPITMQAPFGIDFGFDDLERALKMEKSEEEISEQLLKPAMAQLAQEIDSRCANFAYLNTPNIAGVLGTTPSTNVPYQRAETLLWENAAPKGSNRVCAVSPAMMEAFVAANETKFNPPTEIAKEFRSGEVGEYQNATWVRSMSLYEHTSGIQNAAGVTLAAAVAEGGTSVAVTATVGDTYKVGDVLAFDYGLATQVNAVNPSTRRSTGRAKTVVITQDFTAVGGGDPADIIHFWPPLEASGQYKNVTALPANADTVTMFPGTAGANTGKSGVNGLVLTKDAFALVSAPLEMPTQVEPGSFMKRDPKTGIAIRFTRQWDISTSSMKNRFDVMLGFGRLYAEHCAVRILSLQ
jgi:hypothetical protein